ncbi:MAG: hypothetical protein ACTSPV_00920 [Candidatus Hodarchaeales archaeon]
MKSKLPKYVSEERYYNNLLFIVIFLNGGLRTRDLNIELNVGWKMHSLFQSFRRIK